MALRFDATADRLTRTAGLPSPSLFTMMGWFYLSVDRNDFTTFLTLEDAGSFGNLLQTNGTGETLTIWSLSNTTVGGILPIATWTHLAFTSDGTSLRAYINGVLNITRVGITTASITTMTFGNDNINEFLNGRGAAFKVWDATLSADEILTEMRYYAPVRLQSLHLWAPCFDTATVTDLSGNARDLTIGGTLAVEDGPPIAFAPRQLRTTSRPGAAPPAPDPARAGTLRYRYTLT